MTIWLSWRAKRRSISDKGRVPGDRFAVGVGDNDTVRTDWKSGGDNFQRIHIDKCRRNRFAADGKCHITLETTAANGNGGPSGSWTVRRNNRANTKRHVR